MAPDLRGLQTNQIEKTQNHCLGFGRAPNPISHPKGKLLRSWAFTFSLFLSESYSAVTQTTELTIVVKLLSGRTNLPRVLKHPWKSELSTGKITPAVESDTFY